MTAERWLIVGAELTDAQIEAMRKKFQPSRILSSSHAPRGTAFAVDPDAVTQTDLATGESWTLRESVEQ